MTRIDTEHELRIGCEGVCGECDCTEPEDGEVGVAIDGDPEEVDILTRGLLGNFARFIATGEDGEAEAVDDEPECTETQPDPAIDDALGRVEQAMTALVSAMPSLEERLTDMEERVEDWGGSEVAAGLDRDEVALGLRDRLAGVERECKRLASVPIERIEMRVASAERSLGSLVERAEAAVQECASQREAAESAVEQLSSLAGALAPWVELLELRESEGGMPKPMSTLLRVAGAELAREMAGVRGSLERFAGVLELPGAEPAAREVETPTIPDVEGLPGEGDIVSPEEPSEGRPRKNGRGKKPKAVRAKGSEAETPRRGASEKRLSAEARLRARSRAEGRPPRR